MWRGIGGWRGWIFVGWDEYTLHWGGASIVFKSFSEDVVGLEAFCALDFFERVIAGKTRGFVIGWVPGCEVGSLFARGFFDELHTKWSVAASIIGDDARAALKNCAAQSLLGRSLTGRKGTFASGRLLWMDWEKVFFIFFLGEIQMKRSIRSDLFRIIFLGS